MLKEQCRIGMIIEFGRQNGEKTRGEVIKMNPKMAKVRILEARGRNSGEGAVWNVGYSLMTEVEYGTTGHNPTVSYSNPSDQEMAYNPFMQACDVSIMDAIVDVYNRLSPEWLTADGERPVHQIHALRGNLQRKLDYLFKALGRPVSESVAYKWNEQKSQSKIA